MKADGDSSSSSFGEEPHLAYNRVGLSTYWEKKDPETLYLNPLDWYKSHAPGKLAFHTSDAVKEGGWAGGGGNAWTCPLLYADFPRFVM